MDTRRITASLKLVAGAGLVLATPSIRPIGLHWAIACAIGGTLLLLPPLRFLLPAGTLLARRGLPMGMAARGLLAFSFFGTEAFVPLGASVLRGASPTRSGLALTGGALGWITASWVQDRLESRAGAAGRPGRVRSGFSMLAAGIVIVATALLTSLPSSWSPLDGPSVDWASASPTAPAASSVSPTPQQAARARSPDNCN